MLLATGWSHRAGKRLFAQIQTPSPPFVNPPNIALHWIQPVLVAEIAYTRGH
jgi:hypothetical protein